MYDFDRRWIWITLFLLFSALFLESAAGQQSPEEMTDLEIIKELQKTLENRKARLNERESLLDARENRLNEREKILNERESLIELQSQILTESRNYYESLKEEQLRNKWIDTGRGFLYGLATGYIAYDIYSAAR